MIVFLTLCYVGVLALAVKIGLIKFSLFWKLSPVLWMLVLFLVLFLPMQWGAPSGRANVIKPVVEIVPNVSGEVISVPVEPLQPLEPGDVLFQIDPEPFQLKVNQLEAQLADTIQNVEQLRATADAAKATVDKTNQQIEIKKSDIESTTASVEVSKSAVGQAEAALTKATASVEDLEVQVAAGKREFDRQKDLLSQGAGSQSDLDRVEVQYTSLLSQLHAAQTDVQATEESLSGSRSSLDAEKANLQSSELELKQLVETELPRTQALYRQAQLAADSMIGEEHTSVAMVRAQLESAKYDLEQTTVRAPSRGHVMYMTLRPGQRVANLPLRSWMAFVDEEKTEVAMLVDQYVLRHVRPGQKAEVTLKYFPGRILSAKVNRVNQMTSSGQVSPSGVIAQFPTTASAEQYAVVIDIDDESFDLNQLAGGAAGTASIYTDSMKATHVIRKVMIRMDAWLNYLFP